MSFSNLVVPKEVKLLFGHTVVGTKFLYMVQRTENLQLKLAERYSICFLCHLIIQQTIACQETAAVSDRQRLLMCSKSN